jgi:gamma-glutamylcyclotransferase (GGCT)/AIG2-like uncharacterized protein YtfP
MELRKMVEWRMDATFIGIGTLEGYRFISNHYGIGSIIKDHNSKVYGLLWELTQDDEDFLDQFEGVRGEWSTKESVTIMMSDGTCKEDVLVYISANKTPGKPKAYYILSVINYATARGFPQEYIDYLKALADGK